jgi:hypothetical protein
MIYHKLTCGDNKLDFDNLMTQPLSNILTVEDFNHYLISELIDAKSRQTLSGYPTLRAIYDRYLNSELYCSTVSAKFNYLNMDQFAGLIGDYWVDIVEQVIPATTLWEVLKYIQIVYSIHKKFKYRSYTTLLGYNPFYNSKISNPNGVSGLCSVVGVEVVQLTTNSGSTIFDKKIVSKYDNLCLAQMNFGSEFIGGVIVGDNYSNSGGIFIGENTLYVILTNTNECDEGLGSMTATVSGGQAPYNYLWKW